MLCNLLVENIIRWHCWSICSPTKLIYQQAKDKGRGKWCLSCKSLSINSFSDWPHYFTIWHSNYTTVRSSVYSNSSCSFLAFLFELVLLNVLLLLNSNASPSSEREQYPEATEFLVGGMWRPPSLPLSCSVVLHSLLQRSTSGISSPSFEGCVCSCSTSVGRWSSWYCRTFGASVSCRLKRFRQRIMVTIIIRSKLTRTPIAIYRFEVDPTTEVLTVQF